MIYLASISLRRKRLLKEAGIRFRILRPDYHEKNLLGLGPAALVKKHALEKSHSAVSLVKNGVVLSADTIVYFKDKVIGKPKSMKEAARMLSKLQGRWHTVYTGVALLKLQLGKVVRKKVFAVKTEVRFKKMTPQDIRLYLKKVNPFDKAGAYAIQSVRSLVVVKLKGSFSNAIGLPMEELKRRLPSFI